MTELTPSPKPSLHLQRTALILAAAWTAVILLGTGWHLFGGYGTALESARIQASHAFENNGPLTRWFSTGAFGRNSRSLRRRECRVCRCADRVHAALPLLLRALEQRIPETSCLGYPFDRSRTIFGPWITREPGQTSS